MGEKRRIVLVGATSSIAEGCARLWAQEAPTDFVLIGRARTPLLSVATHLQIGGLEGTTATPWETDFTDPIRIAECVEQIAREGPLDKVLIAHGLLPDQQRCQHDLALCHQSMTITGLSPLLFAEAFVGEMEKRGRGTLGVISSVAGDRGRRSNYVYGAAKGLIHVYMEGLQHRCARTGVRIVLIKPGPTATPMTATYQGKGVRLAPVAQVAKEIVQGMERGKRVVYTPKKWRVIMRLLRALPAPLFEKLDL